VRGGDAPSYGSYGSYGRALVNDDLGFCEGEGVALDGIWVVNVLRFFGRVSSGADFY
jgi:hypothetical protein